LGVTYSTKGDPYHALDYYQKAFDLNKNSINYLNNLASTHYELNNYSDAVATYDRIGPIKRKTDSLNQKNMQQL